MRVWPDHPDELRLDETLTTPVTLFGISEPRDDLLWGTVDMSWRKCHLTHKMEMNKMKMSWRGCHSMLK